MAVPGTRLTSPDSACPREQCCRARTSILTGISGDGHGGIWLTAPAATTALSYFLHYAGGRWIRQLAPSTSGAVTEMNSISWAPTASFGWSGGTVITGGAGQGALLKFSP